MAQHPDMVPDVAVFLLNQAQPRESRNATRNTKKPGRRRRRDSRDVARRRGAARGPKEILIGAQCDRTGPTQIVGTVFCPAVQDYVNLINSQGGIDGYKIRIDELDNSYQVPPAIEEYERHKQEGMVSTLIWGTPQAEALNPQLEADHIPGTSPGFGAAAAANGAKYPYLFPVAATYWSQAGAAIQFVKDKLGGSLKGKKIAYHVL